MTEEHGRCPTRSLTLSEEEEVRLLAKFMPKMVRAALPLVGQSHVEAIALMIPVMQLAEHPVTLVTVGRARHGPMAMTVRALPNKAGSSSEERREV